ncbi:MAG: aryl-sulfate sulfotransferase [Cytophagales bacterium]|nr:aryl-sulfate sulfotransferase [Cytophagales bacterium]
MSLKKTPIFLILMLLGFSTLAQTKIAGPKTILPGIEDGYMLFNPTNTKKAYLIDNCGRVINTWDSQYAAAHTIYLKPNGHLVRTNLLTNAVVDGGGGSGGGVEILDWNSTVLWSYTYNTNFVRQHHDIEILPNGNILILAWEVKTQSESIAAGRNPALIPDGEVWPEHIIEVQPIFPAGGTIVWEWHAWDHLIQDFDITKSNYGVVGDRPELIDVNYTSQGQKDWIHANALAYNVQLDQIMISAHSFNELWVIDHSTSTAQAATHSGGTANKGGDLLYRWGNPLAYKKGTVNDQRLFGQHDTHWIAAGLPDAGKIIYFNNGPERLYSSVEILNPTKNPNGSYTLTGGVFGPLSPDRTFTMNPTSNFFSRIMSSAQMLPNGNLFIGSSLQGTTFEIDPGNQIVWEYKSPLTNSGTVGRTFFPTGTFASIPIFRSTKYLPTYAAFTGKDMTPQEPIEGQPWADCSLITGLEEATDVPRVYPVPADDFIQVVWEKQNIRVTLFDGTGKKMFEGSGFDRLTIPVASMPSGLYLLRTNNQVHKVIVRH